MEKYPVVTICGSSKFKKEIREAEKELCLKGYVVFSMNLFGHSGDSDAFIYKLLLDNIHKQKIFMSDIVYIVDKDGYIGISTQNEINYAKSLSKKILFWSEENEKI